jgi:hypothetical protein
MGELGSAGSDGEEGGSGLDSEVIGARSDETAVTTAPLAALACHCDDAATCPSDLYPTSKKGGDMAISLSICRLGATQSWRPFCGLRKRMRVVNVLIRASRPSESMSSSSE